MDRMEILRQRLYRQFLTHTASPPLAAERLLGAQAQFFSYAAYTLSLRAGDAAYEPKLFVRSWTHRGTLHLFPVSDAPLYLHEGFSTEFGQRALTDPAIAEARKRHFTEFMLAEIAAGRGTREQLKEAFLSAGMTQYEQAVFLHPWGGLARALCERGLIAYAGDGEKRFVPLPPAAPMRAEDARREMLARYFSCYGPATLRDAAYFFGAPQRALSARMAELPLACARVDGRDYYWLGPLAQDAPAVPTCVFLSGFDPMLLGYQKAESLILPRERIHDVFNATGIVFPVELYRCKAAARWKLVGKRLRIMPFAPVSKAAREAVLREARRKLPALEPAFWRRNSRRAIVLALQVINVKEEALC